jgi:hypothetical protein
LNTPSITNSLSPDRCQGDVLYLMGMSYFQKCDDFRQFTAPLYKANILRFHASGLASLVAKHNPDGTLPGGQIILKRPCPDGVFLMPCMQRYREESAEILRIIPCRRWWLD